MIQTEKGSFKITIIFLSYIIFIFHKFHEDDIKSQDECERGNENGIQ